MEIDPIKLNKFRKKEGIHANKLLSTMNKQKDFVDALSTEVGQVLLTGVLERMQGLLDKIIEVKATPEELAEFRAYKAILTLWQGKLAKYAAGIEQINNS